MAGPQHDPGTIQEGLQCQCCHLDSSWRADPKWGWEEVWFDSQAGNQEVLSPTEELFIQGPASAFYLSKPPFPLWENGVKVIGMGWRKGEWVEMTDSLPSSLLFWPS